jgi:hypothetical protein
MLGYLEPTVQVIIFQLKLFRFQANLAFVVVLAYLGGEVIAVSGRGKECIEMFTDFVSVIW